MHSALSGASYDLISHATVAKHVYPRSSHPFDDLLAIHSPFNIQHLLSSTLDSVIASLIKQRSSLPSKVQHHHPVVQISIVCFTVSGQETTNNSPMSALRQRPNPLQWPEQALELVVAAKYWAPEGPETWSDESICAMIHFRHPGLESVNTTDLVEIWTWICEPGHGDRFFAFKDERYKREYLWSLQDTHNDVHDQKFLHHLPITDRTEGSPKCSEDPQQPQNNAYQG